MRRLTLALALYGLWLVLSDKRDLLHLIAGALSAIAVVASLRVRSIEPRTARANLTAFMRYIPWLAWQILISNLRIARLALSPKSAIRPRFIRRAPNLTDARALTLLGTSITLTPGTLTIDIGPNEMFVHALDETSALDIEANTMAERIRVVFPGANAVNAVVVATMMAVLAIAAVYFGTMVLRQSFFDRLLALNGLGTKTAILVALIGVLYQRLDMFVDIALSLFLLNFVTTLLVAKYVRSRGAAR